MRTATPAKAAPAKAASAKATTGKLKVGDYIDGWCTRCKLVLRHTIEAIAGGKVSRVHCNTCQGQHAHRANAPGTATKSGARKTGATQQAPRPSSWETLLRGRDPSAAKPYATTTRYKVNEMIAHPTFGVGTITAERDAKIEVTFRDGPRVLIHAR